MLGRFGLGGQVWPDMHNSNQKSSNCNKEVAPKTCHFKQTICFDTYKQKNIKKKEDHMNDNMKRIEEKLIVCFTWDKNS